jgi:hypothetical protein
MDQNDPDGDGQQTLRPLWTNASPCGEAQLKAGCHARTLMVMAPPPDMGAAMAFDKQ